MMGRVSSWTRALAVALVATAASSAHASAGNGLRLGGSEGRLHPFLDLETRYDSNVSFGEGEAVIGDAILHVRPGLELKVPGDLATVEFSGALDWAQYLGMEDGRTTDLSRWYANAGLAVLLNGRGAVSVRMDDDYRRQVSTSSLTGPNATAVVSDSNVLSVSVPLKPGGGALVVTGVGRWLVETFSPYAGGDPELDGQLDDLSYSEVRTGVDVQWKFLPRTSTVFQAGYYQRMPSAAAQQDTTGFDLLAGVAGLLTPRIGATAKIGYGSASYKVESADPADPVAAVSRTSSSALADVGLEWLPLENLSLRAGYARTLGIDPVQDVYAADGVNAGVRVKLAQRIAFRGTVRWDRLSFDATPGAETSFVRVEPTVEAAVGRWLTVATGYAYGSRDAKWPDDPADPSPAPTTYSKHEGYVRLELTY